MSTCKENRLPDCVFRIPCARQMAYSWLVTLFTWERTRHHPSEEELGRSFDYLCRRRAVTEPGSCRESPSVRDTREPGSRTKFGFEPPYRHKVSLAGGSAFGTLPDALTAFSSFNLAPDSGGVWQAT